MNDAPECKLISIFPQSSTVIEPSMAIETVYHESTPDRLVFVSDSHVGKGLAEFVENYYLATSDACELTGERLEPTDILVWRLKPLFAEQMSWLHWEKRDTHCSIGASSVDCWLHDDHRYCIYGQGFDRQGAAVKSKLFWIHEADPARVAGELCDQMLPFDENGIVLITYCAYEPQLVGAFAPLHPQPVWMSPEFVKQYERGGDTK